ncbi:MULTISPECIES: hypothetical protein [Streptomyces]|uniref:Uncharacterized protein n=1 Tax=Streptomyces eurythermus TaxID=42237 RepID=A0ABW6Z5Z4_9ACTN|nr:MULTISPECIES: hypothetical protein [Streptomyces]QIS68628.1 hypothetical protein HB370_31755 [Streptomyces sp. DSM 40868]
MRDPRGDLLAAAVEMQPQPVAVPSPRSAVLDAEHASVIGTVEAALDSAPDDTGRLVVAGDAYTTWTLEHPDAPHEANRRLPLLTGILRRKRWSSSSPSTGRIRQRKRRYWPRCEGVAVAMVGRWLSVDPRNLQRRHLRWHAVLQSLAAGDLDDARRRADTELHDSDVGMRAATDWRLLLIGKAPARLTDLAHIHCLLAEPGGWAQVFHTFQLALALSVAGDSDGLTALAARAARDSRPPYATVLTPVADALARITAGHPGKAVDLLVRLGDRTEHLGGVRVEREIIQDALARALVDAGHPDRAAHLLHHRVTSRRHHTYEELLLTQQPAALPWRCWDRSDCRRGDG